MEITTIFILMNIYDLINIHNHMNIHNLKCIITNTPIPLDEMKQVVIQFDKKDYLINYSWGWKLLLSSLLMNIYHLINIHNLMNIHNLN